MRLISTKICKTSDIGVNNNLFGGTMLAWLDEAGGTMAAEEACSPNMVTLKMDKVLFKQPVKVNDHIRIYGRVAGMGNTSIALEIEARRFKFCDGSEELVCSTKMLFVNIDDNGIAKPINIRIREKFNSKDKR